MILSTSAAGISWIAAVVLFSLVISNYVKIPKLWDKWQQWSFDYNNNPFTQYTHANGANLQQQIHAAVTQGWLEAVAGSIFLVIGILSTIYLQKQWAKMKELEESEKQTKTVDNL